MTQAFNLAQLANNLNTSGQLDGTDGLSGLVANANLASSGTASSGTFLRGDRTWAGIGSVGKVLQVVNGVLTVIVSTSSTSLVDTGLTATITPSSASNKILVFISLNQISCDNASLAMFSARRGATFLTRNANGGSATSYDAFASGGGQSNNRQLTSGTLTFLDSPATTSATIYKVQMANNGGGTAYLNSWALNSDAAGVSTITLLEIAA